MRNYLRNSARAIALASFLGLVPGLALATDMPAEWVSAKGNWAVVKSAPKVCLLLHEEDTEGTAIAFELYGNLVRTYITLAGERFPEGEHQVTLALAKGPKYLGAGSVDAETTSVLEFRFQLSAETIGELTNAPSMGFTFGDKQTVFKTFGGLAAFHALFECQTKVGWRRD